MPLTLVRHVDGGTGETDLVGRYRCRTNGRNIGDRDRWRSACDPAPWCRAHDLARWQRSAALEVGIHRVHGAHEVDVQGDETGVKTRERNKGVEMLGIGDLDVADFAGRSLPVSYTHLRAHETRHD